MRIICCYFVVTLLIVCLSLPAIQIRVAPHGGGKTVIATLDVCHLVNLLEPNGEMPIVIEPVFAGFHDKKNDVMTVEPFFRKDLIFTKQEYKPPRMFLS
ncbi:MAG: hypothetical protein H7844_10550 [Nitrospirae bacterium YQR-1]